MVEEDERILENPREVWSVPWVFMKALGNDMLPGTLGVLGSAFTTAKEEVISQLQLMKPVEPRRYLYYFSLKEWPQFLANGQEIAYVAEFILEV